MKDIKTQIQAAKANGDTMVIVVVPGRKCELIEALQDLGYKVSMSLMVKDQLTIYWK